MSFYHMNRFNSIHLKGGRGEGGRGEWKGGRGEWKGGRGEE